MKQLIATLTAMVAASPALAATGPFFSLGNTDFVVLLGFILFIAVLVYFKVPGLLAGMLDKRAEGIRDELDEARSLREEAQALLASYERKSRDVQEQADRIVAHAHNGSLTVGFVHFIEHQLQCFLFCVFIITHFFTFRLISVRRVAWFSPFRLHAQ